MSKRAGLPSNLKMRHDWHYVEELSKAQRTVGRVLPIAKIEPNPAQPRVEIGDLTELAQSIQERGVLEPLLVKPLADQDKWLIIAGERRWRAAQIAGLSEVPCVELDLDEAQIAEIALIENLQRKDLTVWEEADGLAALSRRFDYTHEEIARRIGKSRTSITESLTIAALPNAVRERCRTAKIRSKSAILQIARQFDDAAMFEAISNVERNNHVNAAQAAQNKELELGEQSSDNQSGDANQSDDIQRQSESESPSVAPQSVTATAANQAQNGFNQSNGKIGKIRQSEIKTNLKHPVRIYNYQPAQGDFKLALKFKKPVERQAIIETLQNIIRDLEIEPD